MAKKKPSPEHFERGHNKLGWVYVARNNMHRDDIYKVGYTEKTPEARVAGLNTEQRNRTSQIGFFSLMFACAVRDSQGCEQELFKRLGRLLEHERKEFVNAPLEVIVGELLHIQKVDNAGQKAFCICARCTMTFNFCPLPQAIQQCPACGEWFGCSQDNKPVWDFEEGARKKSYKPKQQEATALSPLAKAFILLQSAVKNYAYEGTWTDEEFIDQIDTLLEIEIPLDREIPEAKPHAPRRYTRRKTEKTPHSRKGWMDCPDCLSSIKIIPGEDPCCVECGWRKNQD